MRFALTALSVAALACGCAQQTESRQSAARLAAAPGDASDIASGGMIWVQHLISSTLAGTWQNSSDGGALVVNPDGTYSIVADHREIEFGKWALSGTRLSLTPATGEPWRSYTVRNPRAQEVEMVPDAALGTSGVVYRRTLPKPPAAPIDEYLFRC